MERRVEHESEGNLLLLPRGGARAEQDRRRHRERRIERFGEEAAAAQEETFAQATPLRKVATPDDVAHAIVALLENDMVTGQDLVIDGAETVLYQPFG